MANLSFTNNAATTLASSITNVATSLTVAGGTGALFPTLSGGQYFYCTLANNAGTVEIIKVTARATDTFTITRGQDGTTAVGWNAGDKVELRLVAAALNNFPKLDEANTFSSGVTQTIGTLTLTNALSVSNGGTGATTAAAARSALGAAASGANTDITSLGTVTTTTQAAGDNSTKLATTAYADAAVSAKVLMSSITAAANTPAANGMRFTINAQSIDFRNATLATGGVVTRTVAAAINADVVSTATLGTANGVSERIAVLAIDNAGTVEVAVVNARGTTILDETQLISTTALSTGSTSANVIYSTTARTNVPFRVMGFVDSTQTPAGAWAAAPTQIQGAGGEAKMPRGGRLVNIQKFTSGTPTYTRSTGATWGLIKVMGGGGAGGGASVGYDFGMGGSGGVYAELLVTALPASATVTVGGGGNGVSGGAGNAGSSSSFGSLLTCAGGAGGQPSIAIGGGGTLTAKGSNGGGNGGGAGGNGGAGTSASANTGAGGGGAGNPTATVVSYAGGNGGSGYVIVMEFA